MVYELLKSLPCESEPAFCTNTNKYMLVFFHSNNENRIDKIYLFS